MQDEEIRRFIHDLRNPIGALIGFAHIMQSREDSLTDEQRTQVLESMLRTSQRLSDVVDEFSKSHFDHPDE